MYESLAQTAISEFGDVVVGWKLFYRRSAIPVKLRLLIRDGTYVDIWLDPSARRYSYHWEQRAVRGLIHRHDNAPDHPEVDTFPRHFHDGSEENVSASDISEYPQEALREFLRFIRERLKSVS